MRILRKPARWIARGIFVVAISVATSVRAETQQESPTCQNGTPVSFLANGMSAAFTLAGFDTANNSSFASSLYTSYQETRGPLFAKAGLKLSAFIGQGGTLGPIIKWGFVMTLLAAALMVANAVRQGNAGIKDLGWSLGKAGLGIAIYFFPGVLYAAIVLASVAVVNVLVKPADSSTPGGVNKITAESATQQGIVQAVADLTLSLAAEKVSTLRINEYAIAKAIREAFAAEGGLASSKLPTLPASASSLGNRVTEKNLQNDWFKAGQEWAQGYAGWKPSQWSFADSTFVGAYNRVITNQSQTATSLASFSSDPESMQSAWNWQVHLTYEIMRDELFRILVRKTLVADPCKVAESVVDAETAEIEQQVITGSGRARESAMGNANAGLVAAIRAVTKTWLALGLGFVTFAWLGLIEAFMFQLIVLLPFWVHPKTEKSAAKALKTLTYATFFLPVYVVALLVLDALAFFPIKTMDGTNILCFLTAYPRLVWTLVMVILTPIVAVPLAIWGMKMVMEGATFVGATIKNGLTATMTAASMAVPALRVASLAGAAAMASQAGDLTAQAGQPGVSAEKRQSLLNQARRRRAGASMLTGTQATLGRMFGADEKYINADQTPEQRMRGARSAMFEAAWGGTKAMASNSGPSAVYKHIEQKGVERVAKEKQADTTGSGSVEAAVEAQKRAGEAQATAAATLQRASENLLRASEAIAGGNKAETPPPVIYDPSGTPISGNASSITGRHPAPLDRSEETGIGIEQVVNAAPAAQPQQTDTVAPASYGEGHGGADEVVSSDSARRHNRSAQINFRQRREAEIIKTDNL